MNDVTMNDVKMNNVLHRITDFILDTPLIELTHTRPKNNRGRIFAKMEFVQPGGSVKDRAALQIIMDAYKNGTLQKGTPVVEMTSGNMGAGLAVVCRSMGNPFFVAMSEGNSPERRRFLQALGAQLVLVPQVDGSPGQVTGKDIDQAVEVAKEIEIKENAFYVDQFNNPSNVAAHYSTTGPEIREQMGGIPDAFVACVGTGATFTGTARYLKEKAEQAGQSVFCAPVEPESAAILREGRVDDPRHIIQGTGYCRVPPLWDHDVVDGFLAVSDGEVEEQTRLLARDEGLYVGYSSGANVRAALKLLESGRLNGDNPSVVTILCDTAYKYTEL